MRFQPGKLEDDPRDDDQRENERAVNLARLAASTVLPGDPGSDYIPKTGEFVPHPWVVVAIRTALEAGREEGRAAVEAEHMLLANAMEQKFDAREHHLVSSAFAAIIEASNNGSGRNTNGVLSVTFNNEGAKNIHDRYNVKYSLTGESGITVILEPK